MPVVSIIVLNWNGKHHLDGCLGSLEGQTYRSFECIVVDNGSCDGSVEFIREQYPWVVLICLSNNTGFAAGNSTGLSYCSGKYIVTLNNDTVADPEWLAELVKVADNNPDAGMVATRICSISDPDVIDSLGMKICLYGMSRGAYRNQKYSELSFVPSEILCPSACSGLYRREMIDQTGFFDESFFAYCEDTDLGLRGRRAGWYALLAPEAVVYHKYSATAGAFSPFKLYLVERNHFWMVFKNFPLILLLMLPALTAFRYLLQFLLLIKNDGTGRDLRKSASSLNCLLAFGRGVLHGLSGGLIILYNRPAWGLLPSREDFSLIRLFLAHRMSFKELLRS